MPDNLTIPDHNVDHTGTQSRSRSPAHSFRMDDSAVLVAGNSTGSIRTRTSTGMARHTLGLLLLLCVVFLWTFSNFLGSSILADDSYAKPFFLTYLNTSTFMFAMVPSALKAMYLGYKDGTLRGSLRRIFSMRTVKSLWRQETAEMAEEYDGQEDETEAFLKPADVLPTTSSDAQMPSSSSDTRTSPQQQQYLGLIPTARLSLIFCFLWFAPNYFAMACLQYTTVASTTILTSTSSVWTLLIGALTQTEKFTWRKLCGVLASLAGIVLISKVDLSSPAGPAGSDSAASSASSIRSSLTLFRRALDDFPDKSIGELALGDALALFSAIVYGLYTITLKRTTLSAEPLEIHMPTFFGLVGLFNTIILFPLFPVLHFTGIETFAFPPTARIWLILITNSVSSFASDIAWAYSMVLTSPLVVTVGLSLTIPLSLVGEMVVQGRYEGWVYWVGAMIVVGSFVFVEREEIKEEIEEEEEEMGKDVEDGGFGVGASSGSRGTGALGEGGDEVGDLIDHEDEDEDDRARDRLYRQATGSLDLDR